MKVATCTKQNKKKSMLGIGWGAITNSNNYVSVELLNIAYQ
jgi:hypothetical protein